MQIQVIPCGYLKVRAVEMIRPWSVDKIRQKYPVDDKGYMRIAMNSLLVVRGAHVVLIDPGTADFLPARLRQQYDFQMPVSMEASLHKAELEVEDVTDVIFTHLHFDHGSGAFKRVPGNVVKHFPNARYHVLEEHHRYALHPNEVEASSFSTMLLKRLDQIHWLEEWNHDWMRFHVFNGHTRGMVVPEIQWGKGTVYFLSDLVPLEVFLEPEVHSGYDLDPGLLIKEKLDLLGQIRQGSRFFLFHDPLKDSVIYS